MRLVHIVAKNPPIDLTIPMGDGPALPTGGIGGFKVIDRVDDVGATDWDGQEPLSEDVPLMLGEMPYEDSIQREWNTVKKLGRDPNGERRPPVFWVWGPIDSPEGKAWVLPEGGIDINQDSILADDDGGFLRIEFTLHLLEYIPPDQVRLRGKKNREGIAQQNRALSYTTRPGDTLARIAAKELDNWERWPEIGKLNGISDPHRVLPAGRTLKL